MPKSDDITSFRSSKWKRFDPTFAQMIKDKHPDIWALGGNIKGNDQYKKLYPIAKMGGTANSQMEINALNLREAWNARHYNDFRIAGVIAQVKWLAVGSRGEQYMKNLINEEIKKRSEIKQSTSAENHLEHYGKKGMRWGVRGSRGARKISSRERKKIAKSSSVRTSYKKSPSKLSSAELQRRVKRMETEKRYVELNPASVQKGKGFTKTLLSKAGSQTAQKVVGAMVATGTALAIGKFVASSPNMRQPIQAILTGAASRL